MTNVIISCYYNFIICIKTYIKRYCERTKYEIFRRAKVSLKSINDYSPIAYRITNNDGEFSKRVNTETNPKAIFNIKYLDYKPNKMNIDIPSGYQIKTEIMTLEDQVEQLNVVTIIVKVRILYLV